MKITEQVQRLRTNNETVRATQDLLVEEYEMAMNDPEQQKIHANRVGLLASDELLFQTHPPLFSVSPSYYPGTIYIPAALRYSSVNLLFFIAISLQLFITSIVLVRINKKKNSLQNSDQSPAQDSSYSKKRVDALHPLTVAVPQPSNAIRYENYNLSHTRESLRDLG